MLQMTSQYHKGHHNITNGSDDNKENKMYFSDHRVLNPIHGDMFDVQYDDDNDDDDKRDWKGMMYFSDHRVLNPIHGDMFDVQYDDDNDDDDKRDWKGMMCFFRSPGAQSNSW